MRINELVSKAKRQQELKDSILLPRELTAENGMKALLMGEFHETIEIENPCGCEQCEVCGLFEETIIQRVPVSWDTIKSIYKMIVEHIDQNS